MSLFFDFSCYLDVLNRCAVHISESQSLKELHYWRRWSEQALDHIYYKQKEIIISKRVTNNNNNTNGTGSIK